MIKKLLIANRGEIAIRIAKTCNERGISLVGLYTGGNENDLYLSVMNEAWKLSGSDLQSTWLDADKIVDIALKSGSDAVHPGYGFLSEQEHFAKKCTDAGLLFVGPSSEVIGKMGDKSRARKIAMDLDIPVIPGDDGSELRPDNLHKIAKNLGFPLLLKAAAGGGGKGMQQVFRDEDLEAAYEKARHEARRTFGDDRIIVEKLFTQVRHIEVQVASDQTGQVIHLFERDCSLQRRHQKIIEESPAPFLAESFRRKICDAAVRLAQGVSYTGVGTVEFLADFGNPNSESFYFLEMNTRIQVEHPVTEQVTGIDLIDLQIQLHEGLPLPMSQNDVTIKGHAMECRIYAEDPDRNFMPSSGEVCRWDPPTELPGIRIDSGIQSGDKISIEFDPMLAKIIAYGTSRTDCLIKLKQFFDRSVLWGIQSNSHFLSQIVSDQEFATRPFCTGELEALHTKIKHDQLKDPFVQNLIPAAGLLMSQLRQTKVAGIWGHMSRGFSNTCSVTQFRTINFDGQSFSLCASELNHHLWKISPDSLAENHPDGHSECQVIRILEFRSDSEQSGTLRLESDNRICLFRWFSPQKAAPEENLAEDYHFKTSSGLFQCTILSRFSQASDAGVCDQNAYEAPVTARVSKVWSDSGSKVNPGDPLIALEAMKMEHVIYAQKPGTIQNIHCNLNQLVEAGQVLVTLDS